MASHIGRTSRRTPDHVVYRRNAEQMPAEVLVQSIYKLRANATGLPVEGFNPDYRGMPKAAASAADHVKILEDVARRRGIDFREA